MIFKRLTYLAVCLLVLLNVVSTMGGNNEDYKYYNSQANNSLCLSFRYKRLIDCCKKDDMQKIYVHKTGRLTGIFHSENYTRILCYDKLRMKFKMRRTKKLDRKCQHQQRHKRRHGGKSYKGCTLTETYIEKLKRDGCELYENMGFGFAYISAKRESRYLGLRNGRVQRHKIKKSRVWKNGKLVRLREPKELARQFMLISERDFTDITKRHSVC